MLVIGIIFLTASTSCYALNDKEENMNDIGNSSFNDPGFEIPPGAENLTHELVSDPEYDDYNYTVPWDDYIAQLIKVSKDQLENVRSNVKKNYKLSDKEIRQVDEAFQGSSIEYEQILQYNLKLIIENKKFNDSQEFMIDFTELSNYLLEQIIEYNLGRVNGKFLQPTKWYKQIMRQKVLRQQSKIATNFVESYICERLSICKDRFYYTEYLVEWLRLILNLDSTSLNMLFTAIPDILQRNMYTVKTNIKFKKTVKYIVASNVIVQRDTIDYLDEVITNQKNIANLSPDVLKKGAVLLNELFKVLDEHYDMNEVNENQLEDITHMISQWINGENILINEILEAILDNMQLNLKIWPLDTQRKVDFIWTKITVL